MSRRDASRAGHPADAADQHDTCWNMRRGRKYLHPPFHPVDDRQQAAGVEGRVLDVTNVGNSAQPVYDGQAQVRSLKVRVGIEHNGNRDRLGDRLEIGEYTLIGDREVGIENCEDAAAAQTLELPCLGNGVSDRGRSHARNDGNSAFRRCDDHFNDAPPLRPGEIGELSG